MPLPPTVSCFSKIQIGFTFLVLAHLGSPGQRAVKRVWVSISRSFLMIEQGYDKMHYFNVHSKATWVSLIYYMESTTTKWGKRKNKNKTGYVQISEVLLTVRGVCEVSSVNINIKTASSSSPRQSHNGYSFLGLITILGEWNLIQIFIKWEQQFVKNLTEDKQAWNNGITTFLQSWHMARSQFGQIILACPTIFASITNPQWQLACTTHNNRQLEKYAVVLTCRPATVTHTHTHTHTHTKLFNSFWSGTTQAGWYQKKHSPTHTHPNHRTSFINFLHLLWSIASSLFSLRAWQSFLTTSLQVLFGIPLGLGPSTLLHTPHIS